MYPQEWFEMTHRKAFLITDFLLDEEVNRAWNIMNLGQIQKAIRDYDNKAPPPPLEIQKKGLFLHKETLGTMFFLKSGKRGPLKTNYYQSRKAPIT